MQETIETFCAVCRATVLTEIERIVTVYGPGGAANAMMLDYPLRPAKALRPALCIAISRALGGTEDGVLTTAAVIELLHNAFLIHDDVEDESLFRRGEATLQRVHGLPIAVNVADGMFALSLSALLENTQRLDLRTALAILELVASTLRDTFAGQALELGWIRDNVVSFEGCSYRAAYEKLVLLKTTTYSFLLPVRVGSLCARAPSQVADNLCELATHVGVAFQITDDVLNLSADLSGYGKEQNGDLWEGKRTLMLLHALHAARAADRARAAEILARLRAGAGGEAARTRTEDDVFVLRRLIERHDGIEYARGVATEHAGAALAALERCAEMLTPGHAQAFLWQLPRFVLERLS